MAGKLVGLAVKVMGRISELLKVFSKICDFSMLASKFLYWERAGIEPARGSTRRIYSPVLSTDQPSFQFLRQNALVCAPRQT
jgi:hypothetical protein